MPQYKYIYRHPRGYGFTARVKKRHYLGSFRTIGAAANAVAIHLGVDRKELPKKRANQAKKTHTYSTQRYVYTNGGKFEARQGNTYYGRFDTQKKAAAAIPNLNKKRVRSKREHVAVSKKRFTVLKRIFKTFRPADVSHIQTFRKANPLFCKAPGPLHMAVILGKEKSWRDAVLQEWSKLSAEKRLLMGMLATGNPQDALVLAAARNAHHVLAEACRAMTTVEIDEQKYWSMHVNRNVTHHSGWLPLMQRVKILRKKSVRACGGDLALGSDGSSYYAIVPFCGATHVHTLSHLAKLQQCILGAQTPRTLDEWNGALQTFKKVAKSAAAADGYEHLWCFRTAMFAEMHAANVKALSFSRKNTMRDVIRAFPDQCRWIRTYCGQRSEAHWSVTDFCKELKYDDALQFLTMDLCIFGSVGHGVDPEVFEDMESKIQKIRRQLDRRGRPAHPAVVIGKVMGLVTQL